RRETAGRDGDGFVPRGRLRFEIRDGIAILNPDGSAVASIEVNIGVPAQIDLELSRAARNLDGVLRFADLSVPRRWPDDRACSRRAGCQRNRIAPRRRSRSGRRSRSRRGAASRDDSADHKVGWRAILFLDWPEIGRAVIVRKETALLLRRTGVKPHAHAAARI